jgi:7-keto-8-aminopelargonate synthetase-like enzyme
MPLGPELRFFARRTKVQYQGGYYLFFGSGDYHRLASHPEVVRVAREVLLSDGLSAGGSRTTTANHPFHAQLEQDLASFLGLPEARSCADGFLSGTIAVEACAGGFQRFFIDQGAHASLKLAAEGLPRDQVHPFRHADPQHLQEELQHTLRPGERPLVLCDGVAGATGEIPPLGAYWEAVCPYEGKLLIDDAHALGVLGRTGKGSPEVHALPAEAFLQAGSFSKAFGVFGGMVAGEADLGARIVDSSRTFAGSTPLPPALAAAVICSIQILETHPQMILALQERSLQARQRLRAMGFASCASASPILSVTHLDEGKNRRLWTLLLENGIYPTFTDYPGAPPGGHFRFTLSSEHTDREIDHLLSVIAMSCG